MNKKTLYRKIDLTLKHYGIDLKKLIKAIFHSKKDWVKRDFEEFIQQKSDDNLFEIYPNIPVYHDKSESGGTMTGHYFHQDLYIARKILQNKPEKHIDIGSRVDSFVAHLASFKEVFVFDIRNIESKVKNIHFVQADLMKFDENLTESIDSISCLPALEHFGLGRYGDEIDYWGYLKGFNHIYKTL